MSRRDALYRELECLKGHLPDWAGRFLGMVLAPRAVWVRLPLALLLMGGGIVGFFLPVLGILPLGLALLALDLPFMCGPMARLLALINGKLDA